MPVIKPSKSTIYQRANRGGSLKPTVNTGRKLGAIRVQKGRGKRGERREPTAVPEQPQTAVRWNGDGRLNAIIIEDKASVISALQTLQASAPAWMADLLVPFLPITDKVTRGSQSAVWCKNRSVLLPVLSPDISRVFLSIMGNTSSMNNYVAAWVDPADITAGSSFKITTRGRGTGSCDILWWIVEPA